MEKNIIDKVLSDILGKCSNKEIRTKLNNMNQKDKFSRLEGKMNEAEEDYYNQLIKRKQKIQEVINDTNKNEKNKYFAKKLIEGYNNTLKKIDDSLFYYEKRIFNGYKSKEAKKIQGYDLNQYVTDDEIPLTDETFYVGIGKIEQRQIDLQNGIGLTDEHYNALSDYFHDGYAMINSRLNNGKTWNRLSTGEKNAYNEQLDNSERLISDAIRKTKGLSQDTVLYHKGIFDVTKVVGDHVKFKGYVSATFQENVANEWDYANMDVPVYTYRFLTPSTTKGFCANDDKFMNLTSHREEHEYLLDKGLEGDIVDIDVKNHIVTLKVR